MGPLGYYGGTLVVLTLSQRPQFSVWQLVETEGLSHWAPEAVALYVPGHTGCIRSIEIAQVSFSLSQTSHVNFSVYFTSRVRKDIRRISEQLYCESGNST
jgi:hypothetical protein